MKKICVFSFPIIVICVLLYPGCTTVQTSETSEGKSGTPKENGKALGNDKVNLESGRVDEELKARFRNINRMQVQDSKVKGKTSTMVCKEPELIRKAVEIIINDGGRWIKLDDGVFVRGEYAFYFGDDIRWIEVIELGDQFLRKGGGRYAFFKCISKDIENELRILAQRVRVAGEPAMK